MANSGNSPPHIALFPSAGMGHLAPFLRLAATLSAKGCNITLITPLPTVSAAESKHMDEFFTIYPNIRRLEFQIITEKTTDSTTDDPFFLHWHSIALSGNILRPLVTSLSPPITAFFSDLLTATCISPIADDLDTPIYFVFTTSARFISMTASPPLKKSDKNQEKLLIPGLSPFSTSDIPPPLFNPNHLFTKLTSSGAQLLSKAKGMIINTFDYFEYDTITAIRSQKFSSYFPPIFPIGPLKDYKFGKGDSYPKWLDDQEESSVVYISFGSRTAMSRDQIRELGDGLIRSKISFLWVLKTSKVDKEEEGELGDLLGESFLEKSGSKGIVVRGWANQEEILGHPAIGGFVSHCGWNSVTESTRYGVPILAWPLHGDQRVNAEVVEKAGMGVWERDWGWVGERLIKGEEIADKIREMMGDEKLRARARKIGDEAKKALEADGSSEKALSSLIGLAKQNSAV